VDRICPFLALDADLRTAVAGYDPAHRCLAQEDSPAVDRATQQRLCLTEEHRGCARYLEGTAALTARRRTPQPAPDARFISTRLVLEPDEAWRPIGMAARPVSRTRMLLTGATVLVVGAAGAALSTRGFGLMTAAVTPTLEPTPTPTLKATAQPTRSAAVAAATSPPAQSAKPTPVPVTPAPKATPHIYVAQKGDSLSTIATRFGISVRAIMAANGLSNPNLVNVGQVLVIPD